MKIITWNCNMAFRKKADLMLAQQPDILVVPECEHLDKHVFGGKAVATTNAPSNASTKAPTSAPANTPVNASASAAAKTPANASVSAAASAPANAPASTPANAPASATMNARASASVPKPTDSLWFGHNLNKGLGVFSYSDFRFQVLDVYDDQLKMIVPIAVSNGRFSFTLFAIWANNPNDPDGQYVEQVWKALQRYDALIKNKRTILIGDFNSNTIWDRPRREGNHSAVVKKLAAKGVHSLYHHYFNLVQGSELHPTLYLYRKKERPYHLDYCFASNDFLKRLTKVEVGEFQTWSAYSDHMPLIISFK